MGSCSGEVIQMLCGGELDMDEYLEDQWDEDLDDELREEE